MSGGVGGAGNQSGPDPINWRPLRSLAVKFPNKKGHKRQNSGVHALLSFQWQFPVFLLSLFMRKTSGLSLLETVSDFRF